MTPANEPGFAIVAFRSGGKIRPVCSGLADLTQRTPVTPLTNFRMASVSKQFTAMTVLLLARQQELSLDNRLKRFLPSCPENYRDITLRQLMTHTSGISDYETLIGPEQKTQVLDEDVWDLVRADGRLYFQPGQRFRYSNTGYCLLALVTASVSGGSFPAFVKSHIFEPLAMSSSLVYEPGCMIPHRALGYIPAGKTGIRNTGADSKAVLSAGYALNDQSVTSATKGDGGVYTSLVDYVKWNDALYTEKLLDRRLLDEAFAPQIPVANGVGYGYGWFSGKEREGSRCVFHSGETSGFLNMVYRNPSRQLLIAIFSNRNDGSISGKFEETARQLDVNVALEGLAPAKQPPLFSWLSEQYG